MVKLLPQLPVIVNVMFPGERILYLGTKSSKPPESKGVKLGSKNWLSRPICSGNRINGVIYRLLFLRIQCILLLSE